MSADKNHESSSHVEELSHVEGALAEAFGVDRSEVTDRLHAAGLCMVVGNDAPYRVKLVRILPSIRAEMKAKREAAHHVR